MRIHLFTFAGMGLLCLVHTAAAQPPDGKGHGHGHSAAIERALSNRDSFAQGQGLAVGLERSFGPDSHAAAQVGTGRLGAGSPWDRGQGAGMRDRFADRLHGRAWGQQQREAVSFNTPNAQPGRERSELVSHGANQRGVTLADSWLTGRLANIDHLRDVALRNGNVQLLQQADQLEAHARQQYLWRTAQIDHPRADAPDDATFPDRIDTPIVPIDDGTMPPGTDMPIDDGSTTGDFSSTSPPAEFQESTLAPSPRRLPTAP